ncbi:hypothetical protein [Rhodospirillum centenum]|uniref:Uncharacterized protein n=1 Tax=Rhodospirillum centenum (strain ATCC 51521 / SW) TaxID=414684 RepID=B6IW98_RHOCS|nr:hypothetical protein [Rhodospirillum centenum]ACJ00572.1 hypothetical protein RC1_3210 [Rhodospirillum centenum SW]
MPEFTMPGSTMPEATIPDSTAADTPVPFTRRRLAHSLYRELRAAGGIDRASVQAALARTAASSPVCPQPELLAALSDAMLRLIACEPDLFWRDPPRPAPRLLAGSGA